jgi:hypothetical protein
LTGELEFADQMRPTQLSPIQQPPTIARPPIFAEEKLLEVALLQKNGELRMDVRLAPSLSNHLA